MLLRIYDQLLLWIVSSFRRKLKPKTFLSTKDDPSHDINSIMPYMNQSMVPMFVGMMLLLAVILNTKYVRPKPKEVYKPQETATLKSVSPTNEKASAPPTSDF